MGFVWGRALRAALGTLLIAAFLLTTLVITPGSAAAAVVDEWLFESQVYEATNERRQHVNVQALKSSHHLDRIAQDWANELARGSRGSDFRHNPQVASLVASASGWQFSGENIAAGQANGNVAVSRWIESDGHRRNIESTHPTHIGIGVAPSRFFGVTYVQVFATHARHGDDDLYRPTQLGSQTFSRISGNDRYATAVAVSEASHPGRADTVYLAAGTNFPDALAAVPAAAYDNAPLLLMPQQASQVPRSVIDRVRSLQPKRIIVAGGTSVVSNGAVKQLTDAAPGARVTRYGGQNRYETANLMVGATFQGEQGGTVYVATGRNFPDALSVSALAAGDGSPVILVDGTLRSVPASTLNVIRDLAPSNIVIAGGTGVVSSAIAGGLASIAPVTRLSGSDRFATSAAVNQSAYRAAHNAYIATGLDFPDALTGALLAGVRQAPLYVARTGCIPREVHTALKPAKHMTLIGGPGVLSSGVSNFRSC